MAAKYHYPNGIEKPRLLTSLLDNLWVRMAAAFGHAWVSQYGSSPQGVTGDTWSAALSGLNGEQIANGIRAAINEGKEFPPSVGRFKSLCLGVPSYAAVRLELRRREGMLSPFARLTWSNVDSYAFARADSTEADRMLRLAFDTAREHVMQGLPLPPEPEALLEPPAKPERTPAKRETVEREIARLDEVLGELNPGECPDVEVERGVRPEVEA